MGAALLATVLAAGALGGLGATPPAAEAGTPVSSLVSDPASLVDPFAGTGTGAVNPGSIGEFPGADVPFGMMQWSPGHRPRPHLGERLLVRTITGSRASA